MVAPHHSTQRLSQEEWALLEQVVERFEAAWRDGQPPVIEKFLEDSGVEPESLVSELVHTDLECRLKAGEAARVETYFARFPELSADRAKALGLIAAEFRLRRRREPDLESEEFFQRFPQYREDLTLRLPTAPRKEDHSTPVPPRCPHCLQPATLEKWAVGKEVTCASCGQSFRLGEEPSSDRPARELFRLHQFELLTAVGQGAFGTVYRAYDTALDRIVAVKVPRGERLTPAESERFVREARSVAQLSHPGIVPVHEVGRADSRPYLVSAFIRGQTLAEALTGRSLGFRAAADVAAQVAEALDHAHRQGVVHRDLKPSNIMLGQIERSARERTGAAADGEDPAGARAIVMDFGLARRDEGEITVTQDGQILGTPAYMSPEQARGESHHVDGRGDLYSLGAILYEMLTGELPFRGVARMVLQQILTEEPRPPRRLNDKIPRDLETITLKCLAKEPGRRYASAGELAADLRRYLAGEPILARPVGRFERTWRWARRNPKVASLSGLVVGLLLTVVVGSVVAAVLLDRRREAAVQAGLEATAAQRRAEENANLARQRLDLTFEALDTLVVKAQEKLQDQPGMHRLMEDLLRAALAGLEKVADADPSRGDQMGITARLRLGEVAMTLARTADARKQYEQAVALARGAVAGNPTDRLARRNLMLALGKLGFVHLVTGGAPEAQKLQREAMDLAKELAEAAPADLMAKRDLVLAYNTFGDTELRLGAIANAQANFAQALQVAQAMETLDPHGQLPRVQLAFIHQKMGDASIMQGKAEEALEHYGVTLDLRQTVASAAPESSTAQQNLASIYRRIGDANKTLGQPAEAQGAFRHALSLLESLTKADPANARFRDDITLIYDRLGGIDSLLGNYSTALEFYRKSLALRQAVTATDPGNVSSQMSLAAAYGNLGHLAMQTRDFDSAARNFEQGVAILQRLTKDGKIKSQVQAPAWLRQMEDQLKSARLAPRAVEDADFALAHPEKLATELMYLRATVLARRGQFADAAATAERLHQFAPRRAETLYDVARCYAVCITNLTREKERLTAEEAAQKEDYTARAVEALGEAVRLGFRSTVHILTDPDLKSIRQEEGVRKLVAKLQEKTTTKKPKP